MVSGSTHVFTGRITDLREEAEGRIGRVSVRGARAVVALDLVPEAREGDTVLVHAGVALSVLVSRSDPLPLREGRGVDGKGWSERSLSIPYRGSDRDRRATGAPPPPAWGGDRGGGSMNEQD